MPISTHQLLNIFRFYFKQKRSDSKKPELDWKEASPEQSENDISISGKGKKKQILRHVTCQIVEKIMLKTVESDDMQDE